MSEPPQPQPAGTPNKVPVHYTKGNYFRVIHVDGMYGGPTPSGGTIMMTVFNHRVPFPEKTVNDAAGNEILAERVVKYGFENELEASLVMDLNTAKVMVRWLDSAIKNVEEAMLNAPSK